MIKCRVKQQKRHIVGAQSMIAVTAITVVTVTVVNSTTITIIVTGQIPRETVSEMGTRHLFGSVPRVTPGGQGG